MNAYATRSDHPNIISDVKIKGNEIIDIPGKAIHVHSCAGEHYYSATVQNLDIADNTITGNLSAISIWKTGDGTTKLQDINITNNNLTIHNTTDWYNVAVWLESISGTSSFSDNTVKILGGWCDAIAIRGDDTGSWTVNDNYFDGHGTSIGICFVWVPESARLEMNRNTVFGWGSGIVTNYQGHSQAVLRDNLIYSNNTGVENRSDYGVDATLNYWGDASGPYHVTLNPGGWGNSVSDNVSFDPWYTDEDCTIPSGEGAEGVLAEVLAEPVEETFTVTFDGNGGTPATTEVEVEGEPTVETLPVVTRDGYIFVEWNTQPNGEGNVFTAETVIEADITVYAIWEEDEVADTFTVNVIVENGTVTGEGSYEEGTEVMLKAIPAEGYVFINWTDREDEVSTENPYTFIMSAEAVELLANFEEESEEIDVGMDTAPIDISIQTAENAKSDVVVSEGGQDVSAGTYWVTQGDIDVLDEAIAAAEAAKGTVETQQDVTDAVEELEAAVSIFNDAKQEAIDEEETEDPANEQDAEDDEEIVDDQVDTEADTDNGLEEEVEAVAEEETA